jgi:hypothetical protein
MSSFDGEPPEYVPLSSYLHAQFGTPVPELAPADAAVWRPLQALMLDGPAEPPAVRGRIVSFSGDPDDPAITQVFSQGAKVRLENDPGSPMLLSDGQRTWAFGADDQLPVQSEGAGRQSGSGTELAFRKTVAEMEVFGFGVPLGPFTRTEHVGRPAWAFRFAPPPNKPAAEKVIVDAETGLVLQSYFADFSGRSEWIEFEVVPKFDPSLFVWTGHFRTQAQVNAERRAEHDRDLALRAQWFRDNVTSAQLDIRGPLEVLVNEWYRNGRFVATISGAVDASLCRRPRSSSRWRHGLSQVDHRWTDARWDWILSVWDVRLTNEELRQFQAQLRTEPIAFQ